MNGARERSYGSYPTADAEREGRDGRERPVAETAPSALIAEVVPDSPAFEAGFEPGCVLTALDGRPLTDILDWRWRSDGDRIRVDYIDLDGDRGTVTLERDGFEDWGFGFEGVIFDGVRRCRNCCTFCFMTQLPAGLRPSLYLRDDDYRLSFLSGTFVTLTNLTAADEARIIEQRLSPLHVSLQVVDGELRRSMIGPRAEEGLQSLERLLEAGICCHCQVVLVPGVNDGGALESTLAWAMERPGILTVGIVPLGYTRHQDRFRKSFNDPAAAAEVLRTIAPFQERALEERGAPWVFAADEFYSNAYGDGLLEALPEACHYGDFSLFEDGIGIVRTVVDQWRSPSVRALAVRCARVLEETGCRAYLVSGLAQRHFLDRLIGETALGGHLVPLYVENRFFGGNVDVTGLLCGDDIACAVRRAAQEDRGMFLVPAIVFNDDGLTLDGFTVDAMEEAAGEPLSVVSLSPEDYLEEIIKALNGLEQE